MRLAGLVLILLTLLIRPAAACCINQGEFNAMCRAQGGTPGPNARCYPGGSGNGAAGVRAAAAAAQRIADNQAALAAARAAEAAAEEQRRERLQQAAEDDTRGVALAQQRDYAGAIELYLSALQLDPDNRAARAHLQSAQVALADVRTAAQIAETNARAQDAIATANIRALEEHLQDAVIAQRLRALNAALEAERSQQVVRPLSVAQTVPLHIVGLQNALREIDRAIRVDADVRSDWEAYSERASRDAGWLAASYVLDLAGAGVAEKMQETEKEIGLAKRAHRARKPLRAALARLEDLHAGIEAAGDHLEVLNTAATRGDEPSVTEQAMESVWAGINHIKPFGIEATSAKTIVTAAHLVWTQYETIRRFDQLDANQTKYLAALRVLRVRMEATVAASKRYKRPGTI